MLNFLRRVRSHIRYHLELRKYLPQTFDDASNPISLLCDKYGSDKGSLHGGPHPYAWPAHKYAEIYDLFFNKNAKNVFECGIGTTNTEILCNMGPDGRPGASLYVWRDYFVNANIYGADIDRNVLFQDERIKTGYIDQTDPETIKQYFELMGVKEFDLMIDDGLHTLDAAVCLFENSFHKLKSDGYYVIEDLSLEHVHKFKERYQSRSDLRIRYFSLGQIDRLVIVTRN